MSDISDSNPYVIVRWKAEDGRVPVPVAGRRGLFIPRWFEAAFVNSDLHVHIELEATAALKEIFEDAGREPPMIEGDAMVKRVSVRSDRFLFVAPDQFGRIPLAKWAKVAVAAAAATRDEIRQAQPAEGETLDGWRQKKVSFSELAPRPAGRPRMETGLTYRGRFVDLNEVRDVAVAGGRRHVKAVQEYFGSPGDPVPRQTARNWIRRARAEAVEISRPATPPRRARGSRRG